MAKKIAKRAFLYARFSTPEQLEGDSLRRQSERARRWCKEHNVILDESYQDLGISGFKGKHRKKGALAALLAAVGTPAIPRGSILIVESLDRLSREQLRDARELYDSILRSGIEIVTLVPERHYTEASMNETMAQIEIIFIAARANAESELKSDRVGAAWASKKAKASEAKLTAQCPSWLQLSKDRKGFSQIPEAAQAIKKIFEWCADGLGTAGITKRLHVEKIKPIGRAKTWHKSYVTKILGNRAVIGEYQPHIGHAGPDRRPVGEPVVDYYPSIITQAAFRKARAALEARMNQRGPSGKHVANLFTGLLIDCRDGSALHLVDKGKRSSGPHLISYAAQRGIAGAKYFMLPYSPFEHALLTVLTELKAADILPSRTASGDLDRVFADEEEALAKLQTRRDRITQRLKTDPDLGSLDSLIEVLKEIEGEIALQHIAVERLRTELHNISDDILSDAQNIVPLLHEAKGDNLLELRIRLKAKLRSLISEIQVFVAAHKRYRFAVVDIHFCAGGHRLLNLVTHPRGGYFSGDNATIPTTEGKDFRDKTIQATIERLMPKMCEVWDRYRPNTV